MPRTPTRRTTARKFAADLAAVLNKLDREGKPIACQYIPPREIDHTPPADHVSTVDTCRTCPRATRPSG